MRCARTRQVNRVLPDAPLAFLREQGGGNIVNITSVGGRMSVPLIGLYSATKFAIEGLSLGLAMELEPFGIKVTTVAPGAFATNFANRVEKPANRLAAYDPTHQAIEGMLAGMEYADPAGCVELIMRVVDDPEPPRQIIAGGFAYSAVEQVLDGQITEMKKWRPVSEAADAN